MYYTFITQQTSRNNSALPEIAAQTLTENYLEFLANLANLENQTEETPVTQTHDKWRLTTKTVVTNTVTNPDLSNAESMIDLKLALINSIYERAGDIQRYRHFEIPKKTGNEMRPIDAPLPWLSEIQTQLKSILEDDLRILPSNNAFAYTKTRSTYLACEEHKNNGSNWFLKIDISHFFPTHTVDYVKRQLDQLYPIPYLLTSTKEKLYNAIEEYAFLDGGLPMGTPLSPTLTNLCMVPFDYKLTQKLISDYGHQHFVYTRYADDIIISSKYNFDRHKVIGIIKSVFRELQAPFEIKPEKTHYGSKNGRNWILGIMLNKDNNLTLGHKNNQKFRAMIFQLGHQLTNHTINYEVANRCLGLISYYKSIEPNYVDHVLEKYSRKFNIDIQQCLRNIV